VIVLDTNVLSEATRISPSDAVMRWLAGVSPLELYTTAITEAEMRYGLLSMPAGRRRTQLAEEIDRIFDNDFSGRVVSFDGAAAREFADIVVTREKSGRPIQNMDAQIAAIARTHGALVATRDVEDFADCGIRVINPWTA
jgi:predicted nucleic acid-binding protein